METVIGWTEEVRQALLKPFPANVIGFLPRGGQGAQAMALAHIDARDVMVRLDAVVGPDEWCFTWEPVAITGDRVAVKGRLLVLGKICEDVGEAHSENEPVKSAVSDAIKRCAVHVGVGRFLYFLPPLWVNWDANRKRFTDTPRLDPRAVAEAARKAGWKGTIPGDDAAARTQNPYTPTTEPEEQDETPAPSRHPEQQAGNGDAAGGPSCEDCGVKLTRGQQDVSMRAFSRLLCPRHQKEAAQAGKQHQEGR